MSPQKLINQLEALGKLDSRIIAKLREQVQSSANPPKATSILKYLVKKDLISESEAKRILKADKPSDVAQEQTRIVSYEEMEAGAREEAEEIAEVENSLSEVVDPADLQMSDGPQGRKPYFTDSFAEMGSGPVEAAGGTGGDDSGKSSDETFRKWDTKNQWTSKWPFIGFGVLMLLIMVGSFLAIWLGGVNADKQYDAAISSMKNLTFADAEEKFSNYLKDNPNHKFADDARAFRVQAIMRNQFSAKRWAETIGSAQTLLPELSEQENNQLAKIRDDVGLMLTESLFHETETAVQLETLAEMESSVEKLNRYFDFIDNPLYLSGTARKGQRVATFLSEIENNIQAVNGLIDKEKDYSASLVKIRDLGQQRQTDTAFESFIRLTREYPDLAARGELRELMKEISKTEQDLVVPIEQPTATQAGAPVSPLAASVVLSSTVGENVNGLRDEVIAALVDGAVYGFDAGTGEIRWRHFVGLQTTFSPRPFDLDTVIASDLLRNEVVKIRLDDGEVLWRASIDEAFQEPVFDVQRVLVTTLTGQVILLDGSTGEMIGGAKLPQAANSGGLIANRAPVIYQPGSYSNLYAISTSDFKCKEVLYLGHYRNSISVPPVSWSGYIILVRNGGDFADLLVLKPDETGLNLKVNQIVNRVTDAQINTPVDYFGRGLILFGDDGAIRILELNPGNEISPVTVLAKEQYDAQQRQSFIAHKGSNVWAAGKGLRRYKVQRSLGKFKNEEVVEPADVFLGKPTVIDDKLFHVRRRDESNMASASLVDGKSLKPIWRTDFSAPLAGLLGNGNGLTALNNQGDVFDVSAGDIAQGVTSNAILSSEVIETLKFDQVLSLGGSELVATSGRGSKDLLFYRQGTSKSRLYKLGLQPNDQPQQPPIAIGGNLVVASEQGLVSKIDPQTGRIIGTPFLPPVSPEMNIPWHPIVPISDNVLVAAHASVQGQDGVMPSMMYFLSVEDDASVKKVNELEFQQSIASNIVVDQGSVYGVESDGDKESLFHVTAKNPPSIATTQTLEHRYVAGPWLVHDLILLQLDDDSLTCYDKAFSKQWSLPIGNVQIESLVANPPVGVLVVFSNGRLLKIDSATGTVERKIELNQPIFGAPEVIGSSRVFRGADGTIHFVDASLLE
jgi:outer membrane protein assembly factor BamB/TolA-binding protein